MTATAQQGLTYTEAAQALMQSHGNVAGLGAPQRALISRALQTAGITEGANATNYQELAKMLGNLSVQNFKTNFGSHPASKEFDIQMSELNPHVDMTPDAITNLLGFNARNFQYALATGHRVAEYSSKGGDPLKFYDWNRTHFPMEAAVNPGAARPGQATSGAETRTYQGKTYTYDPANGPRNDPKSWKPQ